MVCKIIKKKKKQQQKNVNTWKTHTRLVGLVFIAKAIQQNSKKFY